MKHELTGVRLLVPDGSLQQVVSDLMAKAGMPLSISSSRSYTVTVNNARLFPPPFDVARRLRPQDATWLVADGRADLAFVGEDLVVESDRTSDLLVVQFVPLSRGGRSMTRIVLAVQKGSDIKSVADLKPQHEVATEYPVIAAKWFAAQGVTPKVRRTAGALEGFADYVEAIVENVETGASLRANGWVEIGEYMQSRTCLIANRQAMQHPDKRAIIQEFGLLIGSVVNAIGRVTLKCNVAAPNLDAVLKVLGSFGSPTVSPLGGEVGSALEIVINEADVEQLIPKLKSAEATRIFTIPLNQFIE